MQLIENAGDMPPAPPTSEHDLLVPRDRAWSTNIITAARLRSATTISEPFGTDTYPSNGGGGAIDFDALSRDYSVNRKEAKVASKASKRSVTNICVGLLPPIAKLNADPEERGRFLQWAQDQNLPVTIKPHMLSMTVIRVCEAVDARVNSEADGWAKEFAKKHSRMSRSIDNALVEKHNDVTKALAHLKEFGYVAVAASRTKDGKPKDRPSSRVKTPDAHANGELLAVEAVPAWADCETRPVAIPRDFLAQLGETNRPTILMIALEIDSNGVSGLRARLTTREDLPLFATAKNAAIALPTSEPTDSVDPVETDEQPPVSPLQAPAAASAGQPSLDPDDPGEDPDSDPGPA